MATAADHVFGEGHEIHPITKMPLETGRGALPIEQQAMIHLRVIEAEHGHGAAAHMRAALDKHLHPDPIEIHGEADD